MEVSTTGLAQIARYTKHILSIAGTLTMQKVEAPFVQF
jgi:hypothetical protein